MHMPNRTKTSRRHYQPRAQSRARPAAGFTAIEIMLAVVIVGITAAIALPSYASYRERIKVTQAVLDIKEIEFKVQAYRMDHYAFPPTLGEVNMASKVDPWGNPYQYTNLEAAKGNGSARKDKNLVPINSDFDLYSMGKDGASVGPLTAKASRDDIIRAGDGRFVGLASDFDP